MNQKTSSPSLVTVLVVSATLCSDVSGGINLAAARRALLLVCLRDFEIGADRGLLFSYDPFFGLEPYPLPGPVFIHELECKPFPEDDGFPLDLRTHDLTLEACARGRRLAAEEHVAAGTGIDELVAGLLARTEIDYIHVRDIQAGCFDFRIERRDRLRDLGKDLFHDRLVAWDAGWTEAGQFQANKLPNRVALLRLMSLHHCHNLLRPAG